VGLFRLEMRVEMHAFVVLHVRRPSFLSDFNFFCVTSRSFKFHEKSFSDSRVRRTDGNGDFIWHYAGLRTHQITEALPPLLIYTYIYGVKLGTGRINFTTLMQFEA
jgi:hypothetical protein